MAARIRREIKAEVIRLRVTTEQKQILVRAAETDAEYGGSGLSMWLLQVGLRAARAIEADR